MNGIQEVMGSNPTISITAPLIGAEKPAPYRVRVFPIHGKEGMGEDLEDVSGHLGTDSFGPDSKQY